VGGGGDGGNEGGREGWEDIWRERDVQCWMGERPLQWSWLAIAVADRGQLRRYGPEISEQLSTREFL
jgi:hypothetical protein